MKYNDNEHNNDGTVNRNVSIIEDALVRERSALVQMAERWNRDSGEDYVQEAYVKLIQYPNLDGRNLKGWLAVTAKNVFRGELRKNQRNELLIEKRIGIESQEARETMEEYTDPDTEKRKPSDYLSDEEAIAWVHHTLESLKSEECKEIIIAIFWDGDTLKQIATRKGLPYMKVYRMYEEGIRCLKKQMSPMADAYIDRSRKLQS